MSASIETISLLRSIDASLKVLARAAAVNAGPEIASDADLDGDWGDPIVKLRPRDWTGEDCKGRHMSECPAEFLDLLAKMFDYFAKKAEENDETTTAGKPVAPYKRKDAARARGWAARIRRGGAARNGGAPAPVAARSVAAARGPVPAQPAFEDASEWANTDGADLEPAAELTDDDIPF